MPDQYPPWLLPYKDSLAAAMKSFRPFSLDSGPADLIGSKVGGIPYWPSNGMPYPLDTEGKAMLFLAQIDCAQVQLPSFPEVGLLQFFISLPMHKGEIRVIHHEAPEAQWQSTFLDYLFEFNKKELPLFFRNKQEARIVFQEKGEMPPGLMDIESLPILGDPYKLPEEIYYGYTPLYRSPGNRIGGYPGFWQSDLRMMDNNTDKDFVLLRLADTDYSDDPNRITVLSGGVLYFMINSEKLRNKDFSDVFLARD